MPPAYKTIGLMDHMGLGNMGDAAIQEAFIANIAERIPAAHLVNFSLYPEDTRLRHHIESYPIRWSYPGWKAAEAAESRQQGWVGQLLARFRQRDSLPGRMGKPLLDVVRELRHLGRSLRVVRSLDLLVMAGGGQLCELWDDLPYNVFKFCLLARLVGTPVFIIGVGADLLKRRSNRWFSRWAVQLAEYVSLRSVESLQLVRSLGVTKQIDICPDPVYALDLDAYVNSPRSLQAESDAQALLHNLGCEIPFAPSPPAGAQAQGRKTVGINPTGFCDPRRWPKKDAAAYSRYLDKLEALSLWLLEQGYRVEFFSSDVVGDIYAIADLRQRLLLRATQEQAAALSFRPMLTLRELLQQIAGFDYVVTCKFHGIVFSQMLQKPVLSLSYLPKMDHLMSAVGRPEYSIPIDRFELEPLKQQFRLLVNEHEQIRSLFQTTTAEHNRALQADFNRLFGKVPVADIARDSALSAAACQ